MYHPLHEVVFSRDRDCVDHGCDFLQRVHFSTKCDEKCICFDRCAVEEAVEFDSQPGRDGEGLCDPRTGGIESGGGGEEC